MGYWTDEGTWVVTQEDDWETTVEEHQQRQVDRDWSSDWDEEETEQSETIAWPSAVPPNRQAWVTDDLSPSGYGYRVHEGVTLSGLAATYLFDPARWREIWDYQSPAFRSRWSPDRIHIGQVLWMPVEAVKTAKKLGLVEGKEPGNSATTEAKVAVGQKGTSPWAWVGAAAGAAALGGGIYLLARR